MEMGQTAACNAGYLPLGMDIYNYDIEELGPVSPAPRPPQANPRYLLCGSAMTHSPGDREEFPPYLEIYLHLPLYADSTVFPVTNRLQARRDTRSAVIAMLWDDIRLARAHCTSAGLPFLPLTPSYLQGFQYPQKFIQLRTYLSSLSFSLRASTSSSRATYPRRETEVQPIPRTPELEVPSDVDCDDDDCDADDCGNDDRYTDGFL